MEALHHELCYVHTLISPTHKQKMKNEREIRDIIFDVIVKKIDIKRK